MPRFKHERLRKRIVELDTPPEGPAAYENWIRARSHLAFIKANSDESELVVFAYHDCRFVGHDRTYIDSYILDQASLGKLDISVLRSVSESPDPLPSDSSAIYSNDGNTLAIRRGLQVNINRRFERATSLVFDRTRKVTVDKKERYLEILQDYIHVSDVHWWPEQSAYCRIDDHGDLEAVVSITCDDSDEHLVLASFKREPLDQYLAVRNSVLVRLFNFDLYSETIVEEIRKGQVNSKQVECDVFKDSIFFDQKIRSGHMGWTKGVQILNLGVPKDKLVASIFKRQSKETEYVDFEAWDFRNDPNVQMKSEFPGELVATDLSEYPGTSIPATTISTDPEATTHYYAAKGNQLPFDTSPIFFRPEILLRYKDELDKYTVESGRVTCRGGWSIDYDFNKAGQVHTSLRRLKRLPYNEQLYWKSFNEAPKAEMSERAFHHWFKAERFPGSEPLADIVRTLSRWRDEGVAWWKILDDSLLSRDISPRTSSREEWASSFMAFSKLVIAGFQIRVIRKSLRDAQIEFDKQQDKSIALLEKLRASQQGPDESSRLEGLREAQAIRSKVAAHLPGSEADRLSSAALQNHGSYTAHFNNVCRIVTNELKVIEGLFR